MHAASTAKTVILLAGIFAIGCAGRQVPSADMKPLATSHELLELAEKRSRTAYDEYRVKTGDELTVTVFGAEELNTTAKVNSSGAVIVPLLGPVNVEGMTESEAAGALAERYGQRYLIDPSVTVFVSQRKNNKARILGQVGRPGVYELPPNATLLDLIALAGGVTPAANTVAFLLPSAQAAEEVQETARREADWNPDSIEMASIGWIDQDPTSIPIVLEHLLEKGDRTANLQIRDGDTFSIPKARAVYLTGSVAKQGVVSLSVGLTLSHALALAGGTSGGADLAKVQIKRDGVDGGEASLVIADVGKILDGEEPDVFLQPNDVIHVPGSFWRSAFSTAWRSLLGLTSLGLRIF